MLVVPGVFVYVHIPKTGGTFVRAVLEDLFGAPIRVAPDASKGAVFVRRLARQSRSVAVGTHETIRACPEFARSLPRVACLRNPFDRYVSQFEFRWWTHDANAFPGLDRLRGYPNIQFSDFLRYLNEPFGPGACRGPKGQVWAFKARNSFTTWRRMSRRGGPRWRTWRVAPA